jgi:DNA-binding CsgD family transcriptional regulator
MARPQLDEGEDRVPRRGAPAVPGRRIVGRGPELTRLEHLLAEARDGHATVAVLTGEPGVGRTTLLHELARRAAGRSGEGADAPTTVLTAAGLEHERDLAGGTLGALVRPVLDRGAGAPATPGATLDLIVGLAEATPVALLVDDAQWADGASLEHLRYAAHRLRHERILLVMSHTASAGNPLDRRSFEHLHLSGITADDAAELLAPLDVDPDVARRCHALVEGHPLALIEGARRLTPAQRQGAVPLPVPLPLGGRLLDAATRLLDPLPTATRRALEVAALDTTGELTVLAEALRRLTLRVEDLAPAEHEGVVTLDGPWLIWRRPVLRAAAHQLSPPGRRRRAHTALAAAGAAVLPAARMAWHLGQSALEPDEAVARRLAEAAGRLRRQGAHAAAAEALTRATRLTPDPARAHRRAVQAAEAWMAAGDAGRATGVLRDIVDAIEDPVTAADALTTLAAASVLRAPPEALGARRDEVAARATRHEPYLTMLAESTAVAGHTIGLRPAAAVGAAERARDAAARCDRPLAVAWGEGVWRLTRRLAGGGPPDRGEAARAGELALSALAAGADEADTLAELCSMIHLVDGDIDAAIDLLDHIVTRAARGSPGWAVAGRLLRAEALWRIGRWADAARDVAAARSMAGATATGAAGVHPLIHALAARVDAGRGDDGGCRAHARAALDARPSRPRPFVHVVAHAALGLAELGARRDEAAVAEFEQVARLAGGVRHPDLLWWRADAVEALWRLGDEREARRATGRLAEDAATADSRWGAAAAQRCSALVGLGDPETGFAAALAGFEAAAAPFEQARTLLARGEHRTRAGDAAGGHADLRAATHRFDRLGAVPWRDRAEAAAAHPGAEADALDNLAERLTAAERRVAVAVAAGLTNREVAARLYLSAKTVDAHLRSIFRKLDLRSRTQLAALVAAADGGAPA